MITRRENLLRVFRHEEPAWVPIIALGDGYNRPSHMPPSFYHDLESMTPDRALARYFDIDLVDRTWAWQPVHRHVQHRRWTEGDVEIEQWETRRGLFNLRRKRVEFPCGSSEPNLVTAFPIEYPIRTVRDYAVLSDIMEDLQYRVDNGAAAAAMQQAGDSGLVTVEGPSSPLMMCAMLYTGVEHLAYAYHEHHGELCALLEHMGEKYLECYRAIAQTSIDGVIAYDNTTTLAISPRMFRELELPYLQKAAEILHAGGKLYIHHACGHVLHLLEDFRRLELDGFHGPAAPPVGDTTVAQARQGMGAEVVLMPFTEEHALAGGDPATIRRTIREVFSQNGSRRNLIINIIPPPAVPVEHLWLAIDEAKRLSCAGG